MVRAARTSGPMLGNLHKSCGKRENPMGSLLSQRKKNGRMHSDTVRGAMNSALLQPAVSTWVHANMKKTRVARSRSDPRMSMRFHLSTPRIRRTTGVTRGRIQRVRNDSGMTRIATLRT